MERRPWTRQRNVDPWPGMAPRRILAGRTSRFLPRLLFKVCLSWIESERETLMPILFPHWWIRWMPPFLLDQYPSNAWHEIEYFMFFFLTKLSPIYLSIYLHSFFLFLRMLYYFFVSTSKVNWNPLGHGKFFNLIDFLNRSAMFLSLFLIYTRQNKRGFCFTAFIYDSGMNRISFRYKLTSARYLKF